ncbi:MAG: sulfotransferase [Pseudomonadales bacterium]|nr:sulfotransferase [Pseudomonadales bacterium]
MSIKKMIILTGHRKSGTSMFHRLFDSHPDIYFYPVDIAVLYAYFPVFVEKYRTEPNLLRARLHRVLTQSLAPVEKHLSENNRFSIDDYARSVCSKLDDNALSDKKSVIRTIAEMWIEKFYQSNESRPFLFKETSQSVFLQEFMSFDIEISMIAMIRDPRDNFAAIKSGVENYYSKMHEGALESLASVINRARMDLLSAKINVARNVKNYHALKFEDLTLQPESTMRQISSILDIKFSSILLEPTFFGIPYRGNSHEGKVFQGISNASIGKWTTRISLEESQIIEFWLQDEMEYWGYDLKSPVSDSHDAFATFYNLYNTRYFYNDSFSSEE